MKPSTRASIVFFVIGVLVGLYLGAVAINMVVGAEPVAAYKTSDGSIFEDQKEAEKYQLEVDVVGWILRVKGFSETDRTRLYPGQWDAIFNVSDFLIDHPKQAQDILNEINKRTGGKRAQD